MFGSSAVTPCLGSHCFFFFFNDTATTEIYTLSLHDALPISTTMAFRMMATAHRPTGTIIRIRTIMIPAITTLAITRGDRKSTRLNSSHSSISYAVFCLKKKNNNNILDTQYANTLNEDDLYEH